MKFFGQIRKPDDHQVNISNYKSFGSKNVWGLGLLLIPGIMMSGCLVHHHGHGYKQGHTNGIYSRQIKVKPRVTVTVPAPVTFTFTFTDYHRQRALNYYRQHPHHPGKRHKWKRKWKRARKGHLPPGLRQRDVLPPGIQMQIIPVGLSRELPHPPRGTRYIYHNDQVLLIDVKTRVVLDFINISVSTVY